MNKKAILAAGALFVSALTIFACSDDSTTSNTSGNNPFVPVDASATLFDAGGNNSTDTTDGGCPNKPAGCFCGTPKTQADFLNRCTNAAAIQVNLTVTPATTANIP